MEELITVPPLESRATAKMCRWDHKGPYITAIMLANFGRPITSDSVKKVSVLSKSND